MNIGRSLTLRNEIAMNQFINESCRVALEKRNSSLFKMFEGNFETLSDILDISTPPGFTYHGRKHIAMVEQYVGRLLGKDRLKNLTDNELFILLMGVLCHDVGMIKYKLHNDFYEPDRGNHNIASYSMVFNQRKNEKGSLEIHVPSKGKKFYKAIALLCLGHRDYKDKKDHKIHTLTESSIIEGCEIKILETIPISTNERIHVQYLAAILRLADEIDVTNQRAPSDVEMHLRSFISEIAKKHWCTHQLIEEVCIKTDKGVTTISLVPDKDEIIARSNDPINGMALDMLLYLLFERLEKIKEEIKIINQITQSPCYYDLGLAVEYKIDIQYDDIVTKEKYNEYLKKVEEEQKKKNVKEIITGPDYDENRDIARLPAKTNHMRFNEDIQRLKVDQNLLEIGNFEFPFGEFCYYFINTQLLLTNRDTLNTITDIFLEHYFTIDIDCIIGIGKAGIILAPNLSLKLNCDSSYLITNWEATSSVPWEESTSVIETAKNVIVLLDVISTGTVTKQSIEKIKEMNNCILENIYVGAVFCTNNAIKDEIEKEEKVREFFSINDEFQFKTYRKEDYDNNEKLKEEFKLLPSRKK